MSTAKNHLESTVAGYNRLLNENVVPFQFCVDYVHSHPALHLSNGTNGAQVRKGNYAQVEKSLVREFNNLMEAFTYRPAFLRLASGSEVIKKTYTQSKSIVDTVQMLADCAWSDITVTVNNKYTFVVKSNH